jgi:hypothetical protein
MESLTLLAKHRGLSDRWADIRKRYSLKWSGGDNGSIQSLQRFFDESKTVDKMIQWVKQAIATLPDNTAAILRYNVLTGLRPVEALQSIRLLLLTENNNHLGAPANNIIMNLSNVWNILDFQIYSSDIPNVPISHLSRRNNFRRLAF